jgi:predicted PurR-regulated permease PerM/methanogenic corrinoid protein MtbC1
MPSDWQRSLIVLATTALIIALIAILYWARSLLIPLSMAVFLTFVLSPLVTWLQHRGLGRTFSVLLVVSILLFGSIGTGGAIAHQVIKIAETLPDRKEAIKEKVVAAKKWIGGDGSNRFGELIDDLDEVIFPKREAHQTIVVEPATPPLTAQLQPYVSPSIEVLGQSALTLILTVYVLIRREDLRNRMIRLLGDGRVTTTTKAVDEASRRISRYLLMQALINITFGLIISFGLLLLGVQYVLLWGFIATVMRYVPYIGTWIGLIPPVLYSFATAPNWGGGWGQPLTVLVFYFVLELVCANAIEPWLYGSSMGLSEVAQLVATAFWAYLWGPIGLILASPLTACLLVLGKYVRGAEFLEVILGDQPALEPRMAFYQRLAAHDQDEASEIAQSAANTSSPDEAMENIVIPALSLIRRDRDLGELDQTAFRFAVHAVREIVTELEEMREPHPVERREERVRLLVCPARDEAENVAAEILAEILEPTRWEVRVVGNEMLASELVESIEEFRPVAVALIALPPGGMSHCRYLVNRIRAKTGNVRILIGRWGEQEMPPTETSDGWKRVDGVDRSLSGTCKRLNDLYAVFLAEVEKSTAERKLNGVANPRELAESSGDDFQSAKPIEQKVRENRDVVPELK